jgi:thioester reductase-like protein
MADETILMTGFPGFISRHLLYRLAEQKPDAQFIFLIQEALASRAENAVAHQEERTAGFAKRTKILTGDIAEPDLGLKGKDLKLARSATHVWHLAAIYNLAIGLNVAYRVNVVGTANMLDFCESCSDLERLLYISTCYVSGDRTGRILETELDTGQNFKNHYESTKCWAEMEVRRRQDRIPSVIFRPGIVIGDSRTGDTDKYDGPYYLITGLLHLPSWIPIPFVGDGEAPVGLVPVDFVTDAMAVLSDQEEAEGKTFQLTDPNPYPAREVMSEIVRLTGHSTLPISFPAPVVMGVAGVKQVEELLRIPQETIIYFNHYARYDTSVTDEHLQGTDVVCADLMSYMPVLVDYVRRNPKKSFLDGRKY